MSKEIKLEHAPIENALMGLKSSVGAFDASFSQEAKGENSLDMADQLQAIKKAFDEITTSYQALLLTHVEAASQAAETLKETDKEIAATIQIQQ